MLGREMMCQPDQKGIKFLCLSNRKYPNFPFPPVTRRKHRQAFYITTLDVLHVSNVFDQIFSFYSQQYCFLTPKLKASLRSLRCCTPKINTNQKSSQRRMSPVLVTAEQVFLLTNQELRSRKCGKGVVLHRQGKCWTNSKCQSCHISTYVAQQPPNHGAKSRGSRRKGVTLYYSPSYISSGREGVGSLNTESISQRTNFKNTLRPTSLCVDESDNNKMSRGYFLSIALQIINIMLN